MNEDKYSYTLAEIAEYIGAKLIGEEQYRVSAIASLQKADSHQLSFLSNASYHKYLSSTDAGCVILHPEQEVLFNGNKLVTNTPYNAFALATELFKPVYNHVDGIHESAVVGNGSTIGEGVSIGANVVIGNNVTIAGGTIIGAGCYIGDNTIIDVDVLIHSNVSIYHDTVIGKGSIIHSNAVIASDGFGFAHNKVESGWQKIHQLGGVVIGQNVEIGAGTTIDRGALDNTVIGNGVKLDNQIQIAHNVEIGENTAIAAATAIAGSTVIGKRCTIAGAVGIVGHLTIVDDVHITAMTLVTKSIKTSGSYSSGVPMNKTEIWRKNAARFNRLWKSLKS